LKLLDYPGSLDPKAVYCDERFLGDGYSLPTEGTLEAIRLLARTEAILIDPIYTGKTLAGLIGLAREGFLKPDESVLFLHTGGFPALFSYLDKFPEVVGALSEPKAFSQAHSDVR
jgi:D-cysteine desulfhydrase